MTAYEEAELVGQIELIAHKTMDAARVRDWAAFDRYLDLTTELRARLRASCQTTDVVVSARKHK